MWYLDSAGDIFEGNQLKGETGWTISSSDYVAVTIGHDRVVFSSKFGCVQACFCTGMDDLDTRVS